MCLHEQGDKDSRSIRASPTQDLILRGAKPQNEDLRGGYSNHESNHESSKKILKMNRAALVNLCETSSTHVEAPDWLDGVVMTTRKGGLGFATREAILVARAIERSFFHKIEEVVSLDRSQGLFIRVSSIRSEVELGVSPPIESGGEIDYEVAMSRVAMSVAGSLVAMSGSRVAMSVAEKNTFCKEVKVVTSKAHDKEKSFSQEMTRTCPT
ncbi:hypothetical protein YC2023_077891 [Brassica napus]